MNPATRVVHAALGVDEATRAIVPPIHLSTTFERDADGSYPKEFYYTRPGNPTRAALEGALAELEGGESAACFASGSAVTAAVYQALEPGDHIVAPLEAYHGTLKLLQTIGARWGLEHSFADMTEPAAAEAVCRPNTKLIWIETPSNPRLQISDIAALADIAHESGAVLVCDNTASTPLLQSPLEFGADAVMHSTTKYLSGHGDVLGGAIVFKDADSLLAERVRDFQVQAGSVPSPFDCWLSLRGIKTLALRMRAHCDNAQRVAGFLDGHKGVQLVHYPGLLTHPGHELATSQMRSFGGLLSFEIVGGEAEAFELIARLRLIRRATSLGSVESLIEHRASIEAEGTLTPRNLIRLSVGIEDPDDLIADLEQALAGR